MANLQVKGIDDGLYEQLKRLATAENRSVSQEIIFLVKAHLSSQKTCRAMPSPAEVLLDEFGGQFTQLTWIIPGDALLDC